MSHKGKWGIIPSEAEHPETQIERNFKNVVPVDQDGANVYGHKLSPDCWCEPEVDPEEPDVLIHGTATVH